MDRADMTHPLTPREKVELKPCPFCGGEAEKFSMADRVGIRCADVMCAGSHRLPSAGEDAAEAWNRRAALASSGDQLSGNPGQLKSGDHAELARLADDLRKFEHHSVGSLKIDMDEVRRIVAACDTHAVLLAENAALRASVVKANDGFEEYERRFYLEQERATEAERKLAEAVGLLREWMGTWFVDADSRGENAIADDTRKFLSKEAERG